jgi:dTDP-4-amino-4,6-dideoxygalactose transaminase
MKRNKLERIFLSAPHLGGNEKYYIDEALDSNWIGPAGSQITEFESELSKFLDSSKNIAAVNSGTSAIHLALILAGIQKEDVILCQSFTFSATANPIIYQGAIPIFIDSESDTWNMSPDLLEEAIINQISKGKKPGAIIVVHLYGMPAKIDELKAIAEKYKIILIEDAAEALGSIFDGKKCGTFGDFGILSFNGNKIITTSAGGALITDSRALKNKAIYLGTQAREEAPHYQHSEIGFNYRMSNICAGIGRGQLEVLDNHIEKRRDMHKFYTQLFKNKSEVKLLKEPSNKFYSNHWLSVILLKSFQQREDLRIHLENGNIESRPLWKPMHMQPIFEKYEFYSKGISEDLFNRGLCLPSGSNLTDTDRSHIKNQIETFF